MYKEGGAWHHQHKWLIASVLALCQQFTTYEDVLEHMEVFKYLGRLVAMEGDNAQAVHGRVESYSPPQGFDTVISRAFSSLDEMLRLSSGQVRGDGQWLG